MSENEVGVGGWFGRGGSERLGCLFTICIQSSFVTVPCSPFFPPKPQRRTLAGDSIFGLFAIQTGNMVPPYQIPLTITDSLRVKAVV